MFARHQHSFTRDSYIRVLSAKSCWRMQWCQRLEADYGMLYPIFKIGLFSFLKSKFLISSYILDISPLSDLGLVKIFSQSVGGLFVLLSVSFALQKLCNFMRSHLLLIVIIKIVHHLCNICLIFLMSHRHLRIPFFLL